MFRKTLLVAAQTLCLLVASATPGHAALFSGACTIEVTIRFDSPVTMTGSNPGYSLDISGGTDLDSSRSGNQACVTSLDFVDPFRRTFGDGTGDSTTWTCASAFSSGSWDQSWYDERNSGSPPPLTGTHTLIGTWNAWVLEVTSSSLNYVGVGELRVAPEHQGAITGACQQGGLRSLKLVGTLVFQDP